jgi:adenine-specific DNA methylase
MIERDRRLIEETFPVREVSEQSVREKNIRHGHISTLHIWWARRPLAASRATAYAALVPPTVTAEEWQKGRQFITELSEWENSLNPHLLEKARRDIYQAHAERLSRELSRPVTAEDIEAGRVPPPKVLDPFAGGGSIPLEALRLGCETHAGEYNPVAVLILKATLEYPQRYGRPFEGMPAELLDAKTPTAKSPHLPLSSSPHRPLSRTGVVPKDFNPLLAAVKRWGDWVLERAREELSEFYPPADADETVVGYIWARTLPCQNPACGASVPLMRQFWLAKKNDRYIALHPVVRDGRVEFEIVVRGKKVLNVGTSNVSTFIFPWPEGFDPSKGTVSRAVVTCPVCGGTIDAKATRRLFQEGKAGQRMVAVVTTRRGVQGKFYRLPTEADLAAYAAAEEALLGARQRLAQEWGLDPVPDEPIPLMSGTFNVPIYGFDNWGSLFNARQKLALITFAEQVRRAHEEMLARGYPEDFARAVVMYLGLTMDMTAAFTNTLARWENTSEAVKQLYSRQALPMLWDYAEANPFSGSSGSFETGQEYYLKVISHLSCIPRSISEIPQVAHTSATRLPYPEDHFDAVLTDPPYYNSVPYADLSDFFYVWLKRSIGHLYPELFATPLTPKSEEICEMAGWDPKRYAHKDKAFFEEKLAQSFREIHRVLKPGGIALIVYTHKSTEGWETVINALLDSSLVVSGAWPIDTEMQSRLRAQGSAALASSIYIVARKMKRQPTGFYNEVREELRRHLDRKLERLWEEGIGGADFFIAAIGSGIEVFGKYEKIMDYEGKVVRADRLLEDVRKLATDFAVRRILKDGFAGEITDLTRFYVLYRWEFSEARAPFDEARKLAHSCGIDLAEMWNRRGGFIKKEREFVRLFGPQDRKLEELQRAVEVASPELIDVLHLALRFWEAGRRDEMVRLLAETGYGRSEAFYRVAQAVSETLPVQSREKKLLDGFLAGRERLRKAAQQLTIDEAMIKERGTK